MPQTSFDLTDSANAKTPRVSVLMPTWQGMEFLERVLDALATQRFDEAWDFMAIDSGSTDGTWELLGERAGDFPVPLRRERIHGVEFDHGDTRNLLAARSRGEIMVFLTQDAIPGGPNWLRDLVANFDDPAVGAAYCRNVPRPDARPLTKLFSNLDRGYIEGRREEKLPPADEYAAMGPHGKRDLYNFNDVASAFRRDLWVRHPFPRTAFGEDILMSRAFLEAGFTVVYDDVAIVEHSHDYDAAETRARARVDAKFNVEWLGRVCVASAKDAQTLTDRVSDGEVGPIRALGFGKEETDALLREARELRRAAFEGLYEGSGSTHRFPGTRMRSDGHLKLLYVVHGFPPDTWAGTEIYTFNIAREMQARGHDVTILTRSPAVADEPEYSLREDEFQGLRVLRMTHRLDHGSIAESYRKDGPESVFRRVLQETRPDVVHFQHLIHMSAGLVEIAKRRGCATVVTCHDYWGLCTRVQMIRPDGKICPSNMGSGCFLCVKEKGLDKVERVAKLDATLGAGKVLAFIADGVKDLGVTPAAAQRRASEYADLRARESFVPDAYAAADLRISPSRFLRDMYLQTGKFDPHTFLYSDNGMRTDHVEALEKSKDPDGKIRFGFVGSLVWYKGGEVLVRAMARLVAMGLKDRVHLHVYGGFDPSKDEHHADLERLAGGAPVTFHGRFDNGRLSEVYADIDVLVVPSVWYENSPITIHEAFLTGTPVLASDVGGMAEYVRDGVDGLHFRLGDEEDLAAKMARLVQEPELLEKLFNADWMEIKTITQNGEEMEARYRGLASVVRPSDEDPGPIFQVTGPGTSLREGAVELQGVDFLLMRPGSAAEWATGGVEPGNYRLDIEMAFYAPEEDLQLGGVVVVEGTVVGEIPAVASRGSDETRVIPVDLRLPGPLESLRLEPRTASGAPLHLRLRSLTLSTLGAASADNSSHLPA